MPDTHAASQTQEFENPALVEAMVRHMSGDRIGNFLKTYQLEGGQILEDRIRQLASEDDPGYQYEDQAGQDRIAREWLQTNNRRLHAYLQRQPTVRGLMNLFP